MDKKDRVAIVISIIVLLGMGLITSDIKGIVVLSGFLLVPYWGYRFIKNDISFLDKK